MAWQQVDQAGVLSGGFRHLLLVLHQELLLPLCCAVLAALQRSIALPDVHSGYGFAIGNVAAFDMSNPEVKGHSALQCWLACTASVGEWTRASCTLDVTGAVEALSSQQYRGAISPWQPVGMQALQHLISLVCHHCHSQCV